MAATQNVTPSVTPDPKTHPDYRQRHNPDAWRDHHMPPIPTSTPSDMPYPSWNGFSDPEDAAFFYTCRAKGLLAFAANCLKGWSFQASNTENQVLEFGCQEVDGLAELLNVVGESIDLATNAARASSGGQEERE